MENKTDFIVLCWICFLVLALASLVLLPASVVSVVMTAIDIVIIAAAVVGIPVMFIVGIILYA